MSQCGGTLIEATIALALGVFVVHLGLETTARLSRAQLRLEARDDAIVSLRVLRHVMRRELAHGRFLGPLSSDSVTVRAFRGVGVVCERSSGVSEYVVAYRGDRVPDVAKDSLELTYPDGTILYSDLIGSRASSRSCAIADSMESVLSWDVETSLPAGAVLVRLFERGSYHLSGSALRYRRGASGRQPLTPQVWSDAGTAWRVQGGRVVATVLPSDSAGGNAWTGSLSRIDPR